MDASDIGALSEPFRSQFGWHVLEVLDRREQDMSEEVKLRQAMRILRERRFDEELEAWLTEIREEASRGVEDLGGPMACLRSPQGARGHWARCALALAGKPGGRAGLSLPIPSFCAPALRS